jgi:uncharacterized protein YwqG
MFPQSLQPYQQIIEATALPSVLLSFKEKATVLHQSKIGGTPYFPYDYPWNTFYLPHPAKVNDTPWPKHLKTGKELMLLLQLNFAEMPSLPLFPQKGILQLFVDDGNWHHLGEQLQVIYHPDVFTEKELQFTEFNNSTDAYQVRERAIAFHPDMELLTASDFRFSSTLPEQVFADRNLWIDFLSITDHRYSKQQKEFDYGFNKISGYHYSQNGQDPRKDLPEWHDSVLLVQFQDYDTGLEWGDGGSAQFFIKKKDLAELNFQDLLFHWDST